MAAFARSISSAATLNEGGSHPSNLREYSRTASRPRARTSEMILLTVSRTRARSAATLVGAFLRYSVIVKPFVADSA